MPQLGFRDAFAKRFSEEAKKTVLFANIAQMNPSSNAYWRRTREKSVFGMALEDVVPPGAKRAATFRSILDGLHAIGQWIDAGGEEGPFLMGKEPCFADVDIASTLKWVMLLVGKEEDGLWTAVAKLDGGRWVAYAKEFEKWEACP